MILCTVGKLSVGFAVARIYFYRSNCAKNKIILNKMANGDIFKKSTRGD